MTINKIILGGRLAKDPQCRQVKTALGNVQVCTLTVTTEYTQRSKTGETKKEVCFMDATVWGKTAEHCSNSLKKGSMVTIEGRIKQEKWTDKDSGVERTRHVVVPDNVLFMEPKPKVEAPAEEQYDEMPF